MTSFRVPAMYKWSDQVVCDRVKRRLDAGLVRRRLDIDAGAGVSEDNTFDRIQSGQEFLLVHVFVTVLKGRLQDRATAVRQFDHNPEAPKAFHRRDRVGLGLALVSLNVWRC